MSQRRPECSDETALPAPLPNLASKFLVRNPFTLLTATYPANEVRRNRESDQTLSNFQMKALTG
jgi:hypothetical protein